MTRTTELGYESAMIGTRAAMEVVRALCVLALLFLNFAHQPTPAAATPGDVLSLATTQSFCGDPADDGKAAHAPCHACRIDGGADLPTPPRQPLPLCELAELSYGALPVLALPDRPVGPHSARGPPRLV
ncbi:MAG: hypothetical protein ACOVO5_06655 [Devosia sp.]